MEKQGACPGLPPGQASGKIPALPPLFGGGRVCSVLAAGGEDVVYLEHPDWNGHVFHTFALCPELYRTILDLF